MNEKVEWENNYGEIALVTYLRGLKWNMIYFFKNIGNWSFAWRFFFFSSSTSDHAKSDMHQLAHIGNKRPNVGERD